MNTMQTAGVLFIAGSTIFNLGAGIGVPRIWTEPDPHARLRMLEERRTIWLGWWAVAAGVCLVAAKAVWTTYFWLVGYGLFWVWVIALSVVLLRRQAGAILRYQADDRPGALLGGMLIRRFRRSRRRR